MRTYSHAILTYAAIRLAKRGSPRKALSAALGATIPDAPMALGTVWLWMKRKRFSRASFDEEVCERSLFRTPDAALHSALPIAAAIALETVASQLAHPRRGVPPEHLYEGTETRGVPAGFVSAFLLGWAGHVFVDFLTHGKDARPVFWPVSKWHFESPVSYRERERHGQNFTLIEHAAVFAATILLFAKASQTRQKADG